MNDIEKEIESSLTAVLRTSDRITDESTDEVRELTLYVDDPAFRYNEGQSIGVLVPGTDEFGDSHHLRRYSIANSRKNSSEEGMELSLLVRRCFYIDEFNGEKYPGRASNYLCDAKVGEKVTITGPYRNPFSMPSDSSANILMIGTGTGIAPFRAFVEQIYKSKGGWDGQIRLFYGAKSGLDLLYMNDKNDDLTNYYSQDTFQAYNALAGRPLLGEEKGLEKSLQEHIQEAWDLMQHPNTYVFLAGLTNVASSLDKVMSEAAGSEEAWENLKQKLTNENRWSKLLYS